jgi:hypothetical protein
VVKKWVIKTPKYTFFHIKFNALEEIERKNHRGMVDYENFEFVDITVPEWLYKQAIPDKFQIFFISDPGEKFVDVEIRNLTNMKQLNFIYL